MSYTIKGSLDGEVTDLETVEEYADALEALHKFKREVMAGEFETPPTEIILCNNELKSELKWQIPPIAYKPPVVEEKAENG